jgi:outer membrane protein
VSAVAERTVRHTSPIRREARRPGALCLDLLQLTSAAVEDDERHVAAARECGNLTPERKEWVQSAPLIVRGYYGASTDCDVAKVMQLRCASIHTKDQTGLAGFEVGRPLLERINGHPLDVAGFLGVQRHFEDGNQPDFWSFRAYFKPYFYGFPWDSYVRTRLGLGLGLSWAPRIPFSEQRDLEERGRNQSKLLNTYDPTADVSVGDLIGRKDLHDTYLGFGVSHRSGIFGWTRLYGNVNGGSNYIYVYLETKL